MRQFLLVSAALLFVIGVLKLTPVPVVGQAEVATSVADPALKTPWGEPDLQGIWTSDYQTPLSRPEEFAGREFLTDEEVENLDIERAKRLDRDYRESDRGTVHDLQGSYNSVYHVRKHTGRRTSLIVDPPDGRLPSRTAESEQRTAEMREFTLALLQASSACRDQEGSCRGGTYGPPSPLYERGLAPHYPKGNFNRANGPEDRSLGERCLGGYNLEFSNQNGFFLGPRAGLAAEHRHERESAPALQRAPVVGRLARPLGGRYASRRRHELLSQNEPNGRRGEPASGRTLDPHRTGHARVRRHG